MIRNNIVLLGAILALAGCSSQKPAATPPASLAPSEKPAPAARASQPADATRRYRLMVTHVKASGLTREQAGALLAAAGDADDKRLMGEAWEIGKAGASAKILLRGVPVLSLGEGREGAYSAAAEGNPGAELALRATASAPYVDGEVPVALHLEDGSFKLAAAVSLTPGRPLLVSESGVPVDAAMRPHSPLILHIVAELDCRADFLRVALVPDASPAEAAPAARVAVPPPALSAETTDAEADVIARVVVVGIPGRRPVEISNSPSVESKSVLPARSDDPEFFAKLAAAHPQAKFVYSEPIPLLDARTGSLDGLLRKSSPEGDSVSSFKISGSLRSVRKGGVFVEMRPSVTITALPESFFFSEFGSDPVGFAQTIILMKPRQALRLGGYGKQLPSGSTLDIAPYLEVIDAKPAKAAAAK